MKTQPQSGRAANAPTTRWRSLRAHSARLRGEEGASLVEFSLSITVLLMVMFGIIGFCFVAYSYFSVSDAAREAARYAMVRGKDQGTDCTAPGPANCIAQIGDIQSYVQEQALPGINPNNLTVSSTWLTSTGASCGTSDSCKAAGNQVQVKVTYTYPLSLPFMPDQTFNMSSTSQMVISY